MMETFKAQLEFLYRPLVLSPTSLVLIIHCLIFHAPLFQSYLFNMPLHLHQPPILYIYNLKDGNHFWVFSPWTCKFTEAMIHCFLLRIQLMDHA